MPQSALVNPFACAAFPVPAPAVGWCASLFFEAPKRSALRLRNFDTEQPPHIDYELPNPASLGNVANVPIAADLHVRPWVSNRAGLESRGRRERLKEYTKSNF